MTCCPRSVDVGLLNAADRAKHLSEHGRDTKCPGQYFSQSGELRAAGIRSDDPSVPYLPRRDQSGLLGALYFAVHRRMWRTRQARDLGQAQLTARIAEQQRPDLAVLLRAQDRQE